MAEERLADFFAPDIVPADLPPLAQLMQARELLGAFITLFHGNEEQVLVRLLVLREMGSRGHEPRWSSQQIAAHFAYINPTKLDTVLGRLRSNGLLLREGDEGLYQISETGRVALAALSTLLAFADQDAELGYLTAQAAGQQQMGRISPETLQHLLARLNELHRYFEEALESQSEYQIGKAQVRLESVFRWVQKGTEVMRGLLEDDSLDRRTLDQAQAIAFAQSRLLRLTGSFQRRINQLQAQRVHLGQSGLTSSDISDWLRGSSQHDLDRLGRDQISFWPQLALLTGSEMLDVTEYELVERERHAAIEAVLPEKQTAPYLTPPEVERLQHAEALCHLLAGVRETVEIKTVVLADTYPETAYRLSLLSLLGDSEAILEPGVVGDLVKLPLRLEGRPEVEWLEHPEVASLSQGQIHTVG